MPLSNYASFGSRSANYPLLSVSRSFIDFSTVGGVLTSLNGGENWFGVGTSDKTLDTLSQEIESASSTAQRNVVADQVQKYVLHAGILHPHRAAGAAHLPDRAERARRHLQRRRVRELLHGLALVTDVAVLARDQLPGARAGQLVAGPAVLRLRAAASRSGGRRHRLGLRALVRLDHGPAGERDRDHAGQPAERAEPGPDQERGVLLRRHQAGDRAAVAGAVALRAGASSGSRCCPTSRSPA